MQLKSKKNISEKAQSSHNKTKKQQHGQLFGNNHPETTVHGYGFDTSKHAHDTLDDLKNRDITYQFQVVNTMCERAKEVVKRTKDAEKQKNINASIKLFVAWLKDYKAKKRGIRENHVYMSPNMINKMERLAEFYNISRKARGLEKPTTSDEGFLKVYRRIKNIAQLRTMSVKASNPNGETWDKHRNNYIFRRLSMLKNAGPNYGLYHTKGPLQGLPTVLHVNMLMWAYTPDNSLLEPSRFNKLIKKIDTIIAKYKTIDNLGKNETEKETEN
jgi:hypothetical protein